jgi:chloramphenicol-sensitive protein RarD
MSQPAAPGTESRLALSAGAGCYLIWGVMPLAFQVLSRLGVSAWETLANRMVWAVPTALVFVLAAGQGRHLLAVLRNPRTLAWLTLSALLISLNWGIYVWAVTSGRVLEGSLGYYLNPLLAMAAGALVFREKIDRIGYAAIALAAVGVAIQALALGRLPLVSLTLGVSFCGYGIVRKRVAAEAQTGLLVECLVLAGPALAYLVWLQHSGAGHLGRSLPATAWLVACGPITAVPLVLFSWAARRVPFSVIGFLQFIAPTIAFVIGVLEGEAFTPLRAVSFACIWGGVALFAFGAWRRSRPVLKAVALSEPTA